LTKLVAGTADWKIIDSRVFDKFKYEKLVEENPFLEEDWYKKNYPSDD